MRLIDECKEEEDRLAVINNEEDEDVREQLERQKKMTEYQLNRFNKVEALMSESDSIVEKAR